MSTPAITPLSYHSKFGGLWTDRLDAEAELGRRVAGGLIAPEDEHLYRHFIERGYVILEKAVPEQTITTLLNDLEHAWATGSGRFMLDILSHIKPLEPSLRDTKYKLLDLYVASEAARMASFSPPIVRFLRGIFDEPCKAFQSLSFERGTEQAIHQDTAYVVVNEPMKLAASWVALEDIQEGTGELEYYEGSHRLGDYFFGQPRKHWEPGIDGNDVHLNFLTHLREESERRGLKRSRFLPKKGDALIWSADLAHGGSAITNPVPTRRSLVTHYCPKSVSPHYMSLFAPERRWLARFEADFYCSMHYPAPLGGIITEFDPWSPRNTSVAPSGLDGTSSAAASHANTTGAQAASSLPLPLRRLRAALRKKVLGPIKRRLRGA